MNNYDKFSVRELIIASRERDDSAFAELVKRYTPLMNKVIALLGESAMSFDDLFAEATVALHTALLRYDLDQDAVTFGLFARICIQHRLIDILRREENRPEVCDVDVDNIISEDEPLEDIVARERTLELLSGAQKALSEYEYKVLLLHIQGYKTAAIASMLSRSAKSVDNAKSRIFRRLRQIYGKAEI